MEVIEFNDVFSLTFLKNILIKIKKPFSWVILILIF